MLLSQLFPRYSCPLFRRVPLTLFTGVILVPLLSASFALARPEMAAQQGENTAEARFQAMDADKDGNVSGKEFFDKYPQMKEGAFKAIDTNNDGVISLDEWKGFAAGHKSSDPHAGMGAMGGMGGAQQGEKSANATGSGDKGGMPPLIMPKGADK